MAHIHESKLTLRICGDSLVPADVSELLAGQPTYSHAKGDEIRGKGKGRVRVARSGIWLLSVNDCSPENLDGQLRELFDRLTDDLNAWRTISESCSADLFVGLIMRGSNEGLTITAGVVKMMADRMLEIGFDVYSGHPDA